MIRKSESNEFHLLVIQVRVSLFAIIVPVAFNKQFLFILVHLSPSEFIYVIINKYNELFLITHQSFAPRCSGSWCSRRIGRMFGT